MSLHYPPEPTGNAPYAGSLAEGLQKRNIDVHVLTAHPHYPEWKIRPGYGQWVRREVVAGVSVHRLRHYLPRAPGGARRLLSEISFGFRVLFEAWNSPDVIVLVSPALFACAVAMLRARLSKGRPQIVIWVQDLYSLGVSETGAGGGWLVRVMTWIESKTLSAASTVLVVHPRFADYVASTLKVEPDRIEVVRNWTHLKPLARPDIAAVRARLGWHSDETVVLHAGNMGVKQGLENVVNAARLADQQLLPMRFVLLGNGNQRGHLRRLAQGIERLQFLDPLNDEEFQATMASANVLLVNERPGVSEMAVPSKLTSYFMAGLPVVAATDENGITSSEIGASGAGLVVPAGDPGSLVDACLALRMDPDQATRLGQSGRDYQRTSLDSDAAIGRIANLLLRKLAPSRRQTNAT